MTGKKERLTLDDKVKMFCMESMPILPPETIAGAAEYIKAIAKELMNVDSQEERYVSLEYRVSKPLPHIDEFRAQKDHLGHPLTTGRAEVLIFNMLFLELLSDLALFQDKQREQTFVYFLSKYARLLAAPRDPDTARFYNWLYSSFADNPDYDYHIHFVKAGIASVFVLMHEWSHKQRDIIDLMKKLLFSSDKFTDVMQKIEQKVREEYPDCSEDQIQHKMEELTEEIACDVSALSMSSEYGFEQHFNCSKTEMVGYSMLSLSAAAALDYLSAIRINMNPENEKALLNGFSKVLIERIQPLAVAIKLACNSNLFFGSCDVHEALRLSQESISWLLEKGGKYYNDELTKKITEYNSMADQERDTFTFVCEPYEWGIFA